MLRARDGRYTDASCRHRAPLSPSARSLLAELIGELTLKSPEFASLWTKHPVQRCTSGVKHLHHPVVGDLDLDFYVLHVPDTSGQRLLTHTAAPGSPSAAGLARLRHG